MAERADFAFLHGGAQGGWVWSEMIAEIRARAGEDARCLALDMPGCGTKRGRDTSAMAFDDIARELVAEIEAAEMRDVILVGHSQAGTVMPHMALLAPDLFRRLVFVTCAAPGPGQTTMEQMGTGLHGSHPDQVGWGVDRESVSDEILIRQMFCNDMSDADANAFMARLGPDEWPLAAFTINDWPRAHLADMPVTYVKCLQDMALTPEWQDRFAERLHADAVVPIDAGHQVMNTQPGELAAILLAQVDV